jgi:hypothetical protein
MQKKLPHLVGTSVATIGIINKLLIALIMSFIQKWGGGKLKIKSMFWIGFRNLNYWEVLRFANYSSKK